MQQRAYYVLRVRETSLHLVGPFPNKKPLNKWLEEQRSDSVNSWHIVQLTYEEVREPLVVLHPSITGHKFLAAA